MNQHTTREQLVIFTHDTDDGLYAALAHAFGEHPTSKDGATRWVEVGAGRHRLVFFRADERRWADALVAAEDAAEDAHAVSA